MEKKLKVAQCRKHFKGDHLVSSGIVRYAGNLFGSISWDNRYILASSEIFVVLLVELFWSVQVVFKKTLINAMNIVGSFPEKRRLKRCIKSMKIRKFREFRHFRCYFETFSLRKLN